MSTPATPLSGEALLELSEKMKGDSFASLCRAAGYVKTTKKGQLRPDQDSCKSALLAAHGHAFMQNSPRLRAPSGIARVNKAGLVVIGAAYINQAKAQPGDAFRIVIDELGSITLSPTDDDDLPEIPVIGAAAAEAPAAYAPVPALAV